MPMVTTYPARATATASRTARSNAAVSRTTWSAAKDPTTTSPWRRARTAAARPIAAMESRGLGSASRSAGAEVGQLGADRGGVRRPGHHGDAVVAGQRPQPVDGLLQQGPPASR